MASVVDASLLVVLTTNDPRAPAVARQVQQWLDTGEDLAAPMLLPYEVASAFTRLVNASRLAQSDLTTAWAAAMSMPIRLHPLTDGPVVVEMARRLRRASAYDAAYLVLAQQLGADLWTLDGPLYRNAVSLGLPVRLIS